MGTIYPGLHQPAQHPVYDETPAYEGYPPTADVNLMAPDPSDMDFYGTLPQANWTQWLSPQDSVFPASASMAVPMLSPQEQQYHNYGVSPDNTTQWDSPATSMRSYPQPSPSTGSPNITVSPGDLDSRRGSTSTSSDKQKRKRNATPTTAKSTRRASTKKTTRLEASSEKPKPKPRSRKTKPVVELTQEPSPDTEEEKKEEKKKEEEEEEEEGEEREGEEPGHPSRRVQERNRVASNKFRVKKREDAKRLRVDEEGMERVNQDLSVTVSDLTLQVYELKMKLLQHTDCECHLIQNYIANEAHRYIQDLGSGKKMQVTPPLPPQHLFRS